MSPSVPVKFHVRPIRCEHCDAHVVWRGDTKCDPDLMRTWMIVGKKGAPQITLVRDDGRILRGLEVKVTTQNSSAIEGYMPHVCAR